MNEPEIALAFSPEPWFEELHRHFTDHGGARVRQIVMDPALALVEQYDTLVLSHRWPALTRRFVDAIHDLHRTILGVYEPAEPAGREFLLRLGVDGVVEHDASIGAFLDALSGLARPRAESRGVGRGSGTGEGLVRDPGGDRPAFDNEDPARLTVVGGTPGAGRTEVALTLAVAVARGGERVLLIDSDEVGPSLVQRLGLPIEPNLRTAIEAVEHGVGDLERCTVALTPELDLLAGLPNVALWSQVRPREVLDVIGALSTGRRHVIADVASSIEELDAGGRGRFGITRSILAEARTIIGVGHATPVGVSRILGWVGAARALNLTAPVHLVVNRSDRSSFREAEIERELCRTFDPASLTFLPEDRRIDSATWAAQVVSHGLFVRGIGRVAAAAFPVAPRSSRPRLRARTTSASPVPS